MEISVGIVESQSEIVKLINQAICDELNSALTRATTPMEKRIRKLVADAIADQPEWISLNGGKLQEEFGLTNSTAKLNTIMRIWMNSIVVIFKPFKPTGSIIRGQYQIGMINADYSDVLSSQESKQITKKGQVLTWLDWLLLQGDKTIIRDYELDYGHNPGRAGGKVMLSRRGSRWHVPPEFAGTMNNNFVTRAIDSISNDFEQIFIDEVMNKL